MPFILLVFVGVLAFVVAFCMFSEREKFGGTVALFIGTVAFGWFLLSALQPREYTDEFVAPIVIVKDENGINQRYYRTKDRELHHANFLGELPEGTLIKVKYSNPWSYGVYWMDVLTYVEPVLEEEGK
jgi:hypothetical protein